MSQDPFEPPSTSRPRRPGGVIAAGAIGAVVLGAGLGLWARPATPAAETRPLRPEDTVRPALQIIVDDRPAPLGPLLEVLSEDLAPGYAAATPNLPPPAMAEPAAPRRPAAGLMKVDAIIAPEPAPRPVVKSAPKPKVEAARAETPRPNKVRAQTAKIEAKAKPERKAKIAEAKPKPDNRKKAEAVKLAKAEKAKVAKAKSEKLAKAEAAKIEKAKALKLARAEAERTKASEAKARRLADARKAKAEAARKASVQLAQARKKAPPKVEPKPKVRMAAAKPAPKTAPPKRVVPVGEGPMRVARNDVCASADPGEAAVCADRGLTARDRQLQRAYRDAEAAGVPASALRRQQARWLQARAAAAREAPWAVEDVYVARISELNDLTRDARDN